MRLLLVSATAGLSETGMTRDDSSKRAKGAAGVTACDQAIADEKDNFRRVQLGMAKAIHLGEEKNWAFAATTAHSAPALMEKASTDWALKKSAAASASYVEAVMLLRAGKYSEAEAAAMASAEVADLEVSAMQRALRLMRFDRSMSPRKATMLNRIFRYVPSEGALVTSIFAEAGDYKSAVATIDSLDAIFGALLKEHKINAGAEAQAGLYLAMAGDAIGARKRLQIAREKVSRDVADGTAVKYAVSAAAADETIAAAEVAIALAEGRNDDARRLLGARERWSLVAQGVVADLVGRVAAVTAEKDRTGLVAKEEQALWAEARDGRLKLLNENDNHLWAATYHLTVDQRYAELGSSVWTATKKSKFLIKSKDTEPRLEVLTTGARGYGIQAGEALLLHAALMAKRAGRTGFYRGAFCEVASI